MNTMKNTPEKIQINYTGPFIAMVVLFFFVGFLTVANQQFQGPLKASLLNNAGDLLNTLTVLITFTWLLVVVGELYLLYYGTIGYKIKQTGESF